MVLEVQVLNCFLDNSLNLGRSYSLNQSEEFEGLYNGQLGEDCVILWTITNELTSISELFLHIKALDGNLTSRRQDISCQSFECG